MIRALKTGTNLHNAEKNMMTNIRQISQVPTTNSFCLYLKISVISFIDRTEHTLEQAALAYSPQGLHVSLTAFTIWEMSHKYYNIISFKRLTFKIRVGRHACS